MRNLFLAWSEFKKKGKLKKKDVGIFAADLEENIFALHEKLKNGFYKHNGYEAFTICDPKRRNIHKANIQDRLLHHAIFRVLYLLYDKSFIFDSYSSRKNKGIHKAIKRFRYFAQKLSRNNTRIIYILKCDIRKFFDNVDHRILLNLLRKQIKDQRVLNLLVEIIGSFEKTKGKGIPLGNLTSQLFSNIYLDYFDHYVKRNLRVMYYVRYADDFVIMFANRNELETVASLSENFLSNKLFLSFHFDKISIRKWHQGEDFLGFVSHPYYEILRTKTRHRIFRQVSNKKSKLECGLVAEDSFRQTIQSYKGVVKHCKGLKIKRRIKRLVGLRYYKSK